MNILRDQQLLLDYARSGSEGAFAELVRRHVGHVYSAALRMVCDAHLAQDVCQSVFVALARSASRLGDCHLLSAWLHRTTRNIAAHTVRTEVRRRAREEESAAMNESFGAHGTSLWDEIAPHLDGAVGELSEPDRDALLLRYFEGKSAAEMASLLGITAEAAQKRVSRALERLREALSQRGITTAVTGIATSLASNTVQAVPAGLAAQITTAATGAVVVTGAAASTISKTLTMTTLKKSLIVAALAAAAGTGVYESSRASKLRDRIQALERQQEPIAAELAQLIAENQRLSNEVRLSKQAASAHSPQTSELLKLRGQATVAQAQAQEIAQLKTALSQNAAHLPDSLTNALNAGVTMAANIMKKHATERLGRMKEALNLSDDQFQQLATRSAERIERQSRTGIEMMTGKITLEQVQAEKARAGAEEQADLQAILTPEQLSHLSEFEAAERSQAARTAAASDAQQVAAQFHLSGDQQRQIEAALYSNALELGGKSSGTGGNANPGQGPAEVMEREKEQLARKLKILESFLSPDQLASYHTTKLGQIEVQASMLKAVLPRSQSADPSAR